MSLRSGTKHHYTYMKTDRVGASCEIAADRHMSRVDVHRFDTQSYATLVGSNFKTIVRRVTLQKCFSYLQKQSKSCFEKYANTGIIKVTVRR